VLRKLKKINKCDAQYTKTCFIDSLVRVGAYLVYRKKRLTNTSKRGGGEKKQNYCVFYLPDARRKKTIDQVYKRRPKEYLGREREREREREKQIIEF
jgi:hypothetical protein